MNSKQKSFDFEDNMSVSNDNAENQIKSYDEQSIKEKLILLRTITNNAGTKYNVWKDLGHLINRTGTKAFQELCKKISEINISSCFPDYKGEIFAEKRDNFNTLWYNKDFEDYLNAKVLSGNTRTGLKPFADMMDKFWEENKISEIYKNIHFEQIEPLEKLTNEELVKKYKANSSNYEILSQICSRLETIQQFKRDIPIQYRPYEQVKCMTQNDKIMETLHKSYEDTYAKEFLKDSFLKRYKNEQNIDSFFEDLAYWGAVRYHNNKTLQDMRNFIDDEIKIRENFISLTKDEKEKLLEKELLDGHGIYVSLNNAENIYHTNNKTTWYKNLRIIPEKGRYSVIGNHHDGWMPAKKIKELKISTKLKNAIKNHTVLDFLAEYNMIPYSYESDMEVTERKLNDSFDQTVYEGLKEYTAKNHWTSYKNKIDALVNKDITFRDVCTILRNSEGKDFHGVEFLERLGTQQTDIINDITYIISSKHKENKSFTDNSATLKLNESSIKRIKPKMFVYQQNVKEYEYNNKKYEIIDNTVYSCGSVSDEVGLFDSNIMFIAKESGSDEYKVFEARTGEIISPDGHTFKTLEETKDYVMFEKHPNKTALSLDWELSKLKMFLPEEVYSKYAANADIWYEAMKNELLSDKSNFSIVSQNNEDFYLDHTQVEIVEESLKQGKLFSQNALHEYRKQISEEIKKNSLIIEGTLDLRHEFNENAMNNKRTFASEEYMQKIRDYGYEFPVIVYEGNEGNAYQYPELIPDKVYEIGEFESIMAKLDAEDKEKPYRGYYKSYFIVIDEDGEIHDERYDIGDRLGGFVKGLHHEWDYKEQKLKENPDYRSFYDTREEAENRHKGQAEWIKTLDEGIEKWQKKHSNSMSPAGKLKFISAIRGISSVNFDTEIMPKKTLEKLTGIKIRDEDADEVQLTAHYCYDNTKTQPEYDVNKCEQFRDNLKFMLSVTEFQNGIGIRSYILHGDEYFHNGNTETPIKAGVLCEESADSFLRKTEGSIYTIRNYIGSKAYLMNNSVLPLAEGVYPNNAEEKMQSFDVNELCFEALQTIINKSELIEKSFKPQKTYLEDVERMMRFYTELKDHVSSAVDINLAEFVRSWGVHVAQSEKVPTIEDIPQIYTSAKVLYKEMLKLAQNEKSLSETEIEKSKEQTLQFLQNRTRISSPFMLYSPDVILTNFIEKEISGSGLMVYDLRKIEVNLSKNLSQNQVDILNNIDTIMIDTIRTTLEEIVEHDLSDRLISYDDKLINSILEFEKKYNLFNNNNFVLSGPDASEIIFKELNKDYPEISVEAIQNPKSKLFAQAFEYAYYKSVHGSYYSDSNRGFYGLLKLKSEYEIHSGNLKYPAVAIRYSDSPNCKTGSIMDLKSFDKLIESEDKIQFEKKASDSFYLKNIDAYIITENNYYRWDEVIGDGKGGFKVRIENGEGWDYKPSDKTVSEFINELSSDSVSPSPVTKDSLVKDWYMTSYPDDSLGNELSSNVTFMDIEKLLDSGKGKKFYDLIGEGDSVIRERVFEKLAAINDISYSDIYERWLSNEILPYSLAETKEFTEAQKLIKKDDVILYPKQTQDSNFEYFIFSSDSENRELRNNIIKLFINDSSLSEAPFNSPWGDVENVYYPVEVKLDDGTKIALPGIFEVSTPSHGGWMIRKEVGDILLSEAARKYRLENGYYFFEEDCDHSIVEFELINKGFICPVNEESYEMIVENLEHWNPDYLYSYYRKYFEIPVMKTMEASIDFDNFGHDPVKIAELVKTINESPTFKNKGYKINDGFIYGEDKRCVLLLEQPKADEKFSKKSQEVYKEIKKTLNNVGIYLGDKPGYNPFSVDRILKNVTSRDNVTKLSSYLSKIQVEKKNMDEEKSINNENNSGIRISATTGFSGKKIFVGIPLTDELEKNELKKDLLTKTLSSNDFYTVRYLEDTNSLQISFDCEKSNNPFLKNITLEKIPDLLEETKKELSSKYLHFCIENNLFESVQNILESKNVSYDLFWNNNNGQNAFHLVSNNKEMKKLLETYSTEKEQKEAMKLYDGSGKRSYSNQELLPSRFGIEKTNFGLVLTIDENIISSKEEDKILRNGVSFDIHDRKFYIKDVDCFTKYMKNYYPDDFQKIDSDLKSINSTNELSRKTGFYKLPESIDNTADKFFTNIKELALSDPSFKNNLKKIASILMKNTQPEEKMKMLILLGDDLEGLDKKLYESVWGKNSNTVKKEQGQGFEGRE